MIIGMYRDEDEREILEEHCDIMEEYIDVLSFRRGIVEGAVYMFPDIYSLGLSVVGLSEIFNYLDNRSAKLVFYDITDIEGLDYKEFFNRAANITSKIASYKSTEALTRARSKGIIGGRPSIGEDKVSKIKMMYSQKYTMRQISQECDVSLGTVYKYCRKDEYIRS